MATTPTGAVAAWRIGQAYTAGTLVTFNGITYRALQGATSIESWNPLAAPALWQAVDQGTPGTTPGTPAPGTAPATSGTWAASSAYTQGMTVTINGTTYRANWWTQGTNPVNSSGPTGSGLPWTVVSSSGGGTTPPPPSAWSATSVYTAGMTVTIGGVTYRANWWTQGSNPLDSSGPNGSGKPWTVVSLGGTTPTPTPIPPAAPVGLVAAGTTAHATVLSWNATPGTNITYTVYENGAKLGTTTATSFAVNGLAASSTYRFTVVASNIVGSSPTSAALTVNTPAGGATDPTATHEFAPYIDMSLYTSQNLAAIQAASGVKTLTLAFVLDSGNGQVGWGGTGSIANDTLPNGSSIAAQIQALRANGADVIISFGGANGTEPALAAKSAAQLQAAYQSVIDKYHPKSLDFDIEGWAVANQQSLTMRDQALVGLKAANPGLKISFTLPVLPTGLDANGLNVLKTAKADGLVPDVVNVMAMDYGPAVDNGGQMGANAISAAISTISQLRFMGMNAKVGITPMIGVNDVATERFTLADAQSLLSFAQSNPDVERLSMWSLSRDNGSTAGSPWASPVGSGLSQTDYAFAHIFSQY